MVFSVQTVVSRQFNREFIDNQWFLWPIRSLLLFFSSWTVAFLGQKSPVSNAQKFLKYHIKSSCCKKCCTSQKETPALSKATGLRLPFCAWDNFEHLNRCHRLCKSPHCGGIWCFVDVDHGTFGPTRESKHDHVDAKYHLGSRLRKKILWSYCFPYCLTEQLISIYSNRLNTLKLIRCRQPFLLLSALQKKETKRNMWHEHQWFASWLFWYEYLALLTGRCQDVFPRPGRKSQREINHWKKLGAFLELSIGPTWCAFVTAELRMGFTASPRSPSINFFLRCLWSRQFIPHSLTNPAFL